MNGGITADQIIAGSHTRFWWRCQNGPDHIWGKKSNDRTYGGHGCPKCRLAPRSRSEINLAFELSLFFDYDMDDHKEEIGGQVYDCDIIIRQERLIVEFDSFYYHKEQYQADETKTDALRNLGWTVIRVREEPLIPISPNDVSVPLNSPMKLAANAVLLKIQEISGVQITGLDEYLNETGLKNGRASEAFAQQTLRPRRKPKAVS
jgi:hypothetical protein